jgi:hypothetical protein
MPTFLASLLAESNRFNSFLKERMLLDQINNIKPDTSRLFIAEGEIKPLIIPFCICIILQNEIILLDFTLQTSISIEQISALKPGLEFTVLCIFVECNLLVIVRIIVCCMIQRKYIGFDKAMITTELSGGLDFGVDQFI